MARRTTTTTTIDDYTKLEETERLNVASALRFFEGLRDVQPDPHKYLRVKIRVPKGHDPSEVGAEQAQHWLSVGARMWQGTRQLQQAYPGAEQGMQVFADYKKARHIRYASSY